MAARSPQPRPRTVLVVDDDDKVRVSLDQLLTSLGYAALTAADGREALDLFARRRDDIALALIDVLMPGADGPTVLADLRQQRPELAACFLSSIASGYSEAELLQHGAAAVLNKPLRPDVVAATIARLVP
jgi:two-component system, cell cycle sensor histidine kinase and response regulator CckA